MKSLTIFTAALLIVSDPSWAAVISTRTKAETGSSNLSQPVKAQSPDLTEPVDDGKTWQIWGSDASYVAGDEAWYSHSNFSIVDRPAQNTKDIEGKPPTDISTESRTSDLTYDLGVEVFSHLADRNFIIRKATQAIITYLSRNFAWAGVLAVVGAAERTWPEIKAWTQLDEEDHGHGGSEATHALAEVITTIGHVGFEMLFWGLAGFVNPEDYHEKAGLGADGLAELAGVDEHDEFFKDNAIESGGTTMFWIIMGFFYLVNNLT